MTEAPGNEGEATIRRVAVTAVKAPLDRPHKTASGTVNDSLLALIDVDCGGVVGRSYVFIYASEAVAPLVGLIEAIGESLVGRSVAPQRIYDDLQAKFRIIGTTGLIGYALGGIDMALWDAFGQLHHQPLWQVLGAAPRPTRIYESMGMMTAEETLAEAQTAADAGVTAFKVKAGHPDPRRDREVGEALRHVAGPAGDVMFDYNQAFTPAEAVRRLVELENLALTWIEEPVAADDIAGHAQVRNASSVPVQTGENLWSAAQLERVVAAGATDLLMIDASRIGGLTGWLRAAAVANAHNIPLSTHFYPEISIHALAATPTAHLVEWLDVSSSIVAEPVQPENGVLAPTDTPGAGITWNDAAVKKCRF